MTPYILPKALPDETLYSLVSRITWLNGLPSDRLACEILLGDVDMPRVSDALVDLVHFCAVTENAYGQPDDVLNNLTIWPLFRQMATHPSIEVPRTESPDDKLTLAPLDLGLAGLSNAQPHIWRWCSACIAQDTEAYEISYWHRAHQLPGVVICPLHGVSLNEVQLPYWTRQKHFLSLETDRAGFDSTVSYAAGDCPGLALEIARFAGAVLDSEEGKTTPAIIRGAFLDGLCARNLIGGKTNIHPHGFAGSFLEHHGTLAHINHFSPYLNAKTLTRLAKTMSISSMMLPPTLSLMIANWLFGSWDLFRAHCDWRRTIDTPVTLGRTPLLQAGVSARAPEQSREEHRQVFLKFMASEPIVSRTYFWHMHPKSCRWLAQFDCDWLESKLPKAKRNTPRQLQLF